jgi:hypothetical protein
LRNDLVDTKAGRKLGFEAPASNEGDGDERETQIYGKRQAHIPLTQAQVWVDTGIARSLSGGEAPAIAVQRGSTAVQKYVEKLTHRHILGMS